MEDVAHAIPVDGFVVLVEGLSEDVCDEVQEYDNEDEEVEKLQNNTKNRSRRCKHIIVIFHLISPYCICHNMYKRGWKINIMSIATWIQQMECRAK